jgi:sugar lactone lactonase YvrE
MKEQEAELVLDARAGLGEGAIWHDKVLYWVDIEIGDIHIFNPDTGTDRIIKLGQAVGTVVPRAAGGVAVAVKGGFGVVDLETEELTILADPEPDLPENRFNDGKCDPQGRFWAGTAAITCDQPVGTLYRMDADHSIHAMVEKVTISNGIVWTGDRKTMYFIDTALECVDAFDYEDDSGSVSNRRTVIEIDKPAHGWPDGMAIDENDNIWIAMWEGNGVTNWDPRAGELLGKIRIDSAQATSCAFGGPNLDELYITSAAKGLNESHGGGLFRAKLDTKGVPSIPFAG